MCYEFHLDWEGAGQPALISRFQGSAVADLPAIERRGIFRFGFRQADMEVVEFRLVAEDEPVAGLGVQEGVPGSHGDEIGTIGGFVAWSEVIRHDHAGQMIAR